MLTPESIRLTTLYLHIIQTPNCLRLCTASLSKTEDQGVTYFANIFDFNPCVIRWACNLQLEVLAWFKSRTAGHWRAWGRCADHRELQIWQWDDQCPCQVRICQRYWTRSLWCSQPSHPHVCLFSINSPNIHCMMFSHSEVFSSYNILAKTFSYLNFAPSPDFTTWFVSIPARVPA